jgi:outer membrane protein OmpA-like peptidoglycan-associated protein
VPEDAANKDPSIEADDATREAAPAETRLPEFAELRELLLGDEQHRLAELERRLDEWGVSSEELAERLPEAVALRTARDKQLARSLAPTLQEAFGESVQRNPQQIAHAIFPILGPAIRKAIAETMAGFVNTLNRAIESSLSYRGIKWRIEAWRTGVPYAQIVIKHALVYRVEQVYLIHRDTGLLLAQVAAEDLATQDADLISGMLTAIRDFVHDSFGSQDEAGGGLRTFSVGDRTVLAEQGPKAVLAAVVRGQHPPSLLERLQGTLETIHLHFGSALASFDGDSTPFEPAKPLLEECLETVLTTDRTETRGAAPRVAWALVIIVVIAVVTLWARATVRWNRAVSALMSEPGVVVVEADRGIWRSSIVGLVDPLAVDPAQRLMEMRIDTGRVEARWAPYLSSDPVMIARRARRATDAPATARFALTGDTLLVTGAAPYHWLDRIRSSPILPAGVSRVDLSMAERIVPAVLSDAQRRIETQRVLFDIGSAAFDQNALDVIAAVAARFETMIASHSDSGYRMRLELIGRTDSTGSNETNRVLSQQRADAVRRELVTQGMPPAAIAASGVGTSDPIQAEDPLERASLNRSVSFVVTVTYVTSGGGS